MTNQPVATSPVVPSALPFYGAKPISSGVFAHPDGTMTILTATDIGDLLDPKRNEDEGTGILTIPIQTAQEWNGLRQLTAIMPHYHPEGVGYPPKDKNHKIGVIFVEEDSMVFGDPLRISVAPLPENHSLAAYVGQGLIVHGMIDTKTFTGNKVDEGGYLLDVGNRPYGYLVVTPCTVDPIPWRKILNQIPAPGHIMIIKLESLFDVLSAMVGVSDYVALTTSNSSNGKVSAFALGLTEFLVPTTGVFTMLSAQPIKPESLATSLGAAMAAVKLTPGS